MEGSGCYGHNGADDAAADAALIARALPGRPVRVQWMREQEHAWEPYGPAMLIKVRAALGDDGRIAGWNYDLWSNTHSTRPGGAGALIAGAPHRARRSRRRRRSSTSAPTAMATATPIRLYAFPNKRVLWHFLPDMPLRVSALRALGAYANVFAIESIMDELALAAEPIRSSSGSATSRTSAPATWSSSRRSASAGRTRRCRPVADAASASPATRTAPPIWRSRSKSRSSARPAACASSRAVSAIDSGEIVNPDGIRNQTEGGILQAISWTLYEAVTFDDTRITSVDWASYPILRFASVPDSVEVHVVDRPGEPFLGTGEAAQGPAAAAVGNAVRNAIGKRLYDLPLTRERVKASDRESSAQKAGSEGSAPVRFPSRRSRRGRAAPARLAAERSFGSGDGSGIHDMSSASA